MQRNSIFLQEGPRQVGLYVKAAEQREGMQYKVGVTAGAGGMAAAGKLGGYAGRTGKRAEGVYLVHIR